MERVSQIRSLLAVTTPTKHPQLNERVVNHVTQHLSLFRCGQRVVYHDDV